MKTEPIFKFTKAIVPKALSLLSALSGSLPILIFYLFTVLWYTVLNRAETYEILQLELFWSFRKFLAGNPRLGIEIAGNIIMFMPFGFLLCDLFYKQNLTSITEPSAFSSSFSTSDVQVKRKSGDSRRFFRYGKWLLIPLLALSFSLLIESLQLTLVRGLAEADDLFNNTLGAVLGICSYKVLRKLSTKRTFKTMLAIIRAAFVLICLTVLIFDRKVYPLKENNLTRSFCFQIDEASIQGKELTLRGFTFGYGRRLVPPRLVLQSTKAGDQIDVNVNLHPTKTEDQSAMNVSFRQTNTVNNIDENNIQMDITYGAARPDVNAYFLCDYDYTNVGFTATGIVNPEIEYEIMIGWPLGKLVSTGVYILGEDVHRVAYESTYYEKLKTSKKEERLSDIDKDEKLHESDGTERHSRTDEVDSLRISTDKEQFSDTGEEEVLIGTTTKENLAGTTRFETPDLPTDFVKNGTLLVCRPDMHIWIFQYDGSLYWVAGEGFHFEEDGMTYIQYHLWTTQTEKLPPGRLAENHFWNNLSGYFEKLEISGDFGKYRVMRCDLPTDYSITSILTGFHKDGTWIWANSFRPVYVF